jgi:hypothetical protein
MYAIAKKYLALAAAVMMTTALGTGCSGGQKTAEQPTAKAKVAVSARSIQADISKITLTVDAGTGGAAAGLPFSVDLSKASTGNVWNANVTGIPAPAAPGVSRLFTAAAFNSANVKIFEGSTNATVIAGNTAAVTIVLQELNPNPGAQNYAPVITALTASNSYVLPGQTGTFSVTAYDPDDAAHYNRPAFAGGLAYLWTASCDNGTIALGSATAATTTFTAPAAPVTSALCQVSIKVSETGLANNSSVTTYFTLSVNGNFGSADVFAFPNSYPIVTVRGDLRYNFFSDVTAFPVGQQGDLFFTALDPDGDDVRFDLTGACGTGFDAAGALAGGSALAANQFSAITKTTANGGPVSPVTASALFTFNPTFAYPSPVVSFTDPTRSCQFVVDVHDLCTAGNCGATGAAGSLPNGANKTTTIGGAAVTSHTIGALNATAPSQARRAPAIVRAVAPNQLPTSPPASGVQSWDPQKVAIVLPGTAYNLTAEAFDQYEAGPLTAAWSCNTGNMPTAAVVNTQTNGVKSLKSASTWTSPATLVGAMSCTVTFTSTASTLSTVVTFQFAGNDPCIGIANNTACTHANKCVAGATCQNSVCTPPTGTFNVTNGATVPTTGVSGTAACVVANDAFGAPDTCHTAGQCNANTGACSNPIVTVATTCNADNSGCTVADSCNLTTGACTAGPAPTSCPNVPANSFCYDGAASPASICAPTAGSATAYTCNFPARALGFTCSPANAAVKCTGSVPFAAYQCDGAGACLGNGVGTCAGGQCSSGGTCQAATGQCSGGTNVAAGTSCDLDANACTLDTCNGSGTCVAGASCPAGTACQSTTVGCVALAPVPSAAADLRISPPASLAINSTSHSFVAGTIASTTAVPFGPSATWPVASGGGLDIFVARYNSAGTIDWAVNIGDDDPTIDIQDQSAVGMAVTADNTAVITGKLTGTVTFGSNTVISASGIAFLGGLNANGPIIPVVSGPLADVRLWARPFNLGTAGLVKSIASNPGLASGAGSNRVAVCGQTNVAATQFAAGCDKLTATGVPTTAALCTAATGTFTAATTVVYNGGAAGSLPDAVLGVFDTFGNRIWGFQLVGGVNTTESCNSVAIADNGDVVATGWFDGASITFPTTSGTALVLNSPGADATKKYMWVARYNAAGAIQNAVAFTGTANINPQGIAMTSTDDVYVVGAFTGTATIGAAISDAGSADAFFVKLTGATLAPAWNAQRFGGTDVDGLKSVATTSLGDALLFGSIGAAPTTGAVVQTSAGAADMVFVKVHGATGAVDFQTRYGNNLTQTGDQVAVNRSGLPADIDHWSFVGTSSGTVAYAPAGSAQATSTDVNLVFGALAVP